MTGPRIAEVQMAVRSLLLFLLMAFPLTSHAGQIPGLGTTVALKAREQLVDEFLGQLFGQAGVPVIVDQRITGTVNGDWEDTAANLHEHTMHTFQLVTYYDGVVAYVYKLNDLTQTILPVSKSTAQKIIALAKGMRLPDLHNRLNVAGDSGLVVSGTPRFIEQIEEISVSVRRNTKKYVPQMVERLFELKTSWAHDTTVEVGDTRVFVPGMVSILNDLMAGKPMSASTDEHSSTAPQQVKSIGGDARLISSTAMNTQPSPQIPAPRSPGINMDDVDSTGVRIVAVPNLNAVLIRDYENRMKSYETLIASLDVEPYMLEIEATIIDLNSDRSREFGVNWRLQSDDGNEALVGNGTASDQLLRPDTTITPQGQGGVLSLALGNQAEKFLARIRALEMEGDAEIISKPHVVTLSNEEAVLDTTQSFFVRVAGVEEASLFKITAGTTLRVTPHVYKVDGDFRIKLLVNISDGATTDATVDQIPVIGQSRISTQAIVKAGDSLLVGGLVRESRRDAVTKVPLLGDLPGLGSMFRSRSRSGNKVERMFLITPRLAYRHAANDIRMDAPLLQGQMEDVINMSVHRGTDARESMESVISARHVPDKPVPLATPKPEIAPLPKQDILIAGDGEEITNGTAFVADNHAIPGGTRSWSANQLKAMLKIPPVPPRSVLTAATIDSEPEDDETTQVVVRKKWAVQAMPDPVTFPVDVIQSRVVRKSFGADGSATSASLDSMVATNVSADIADSPNSKRASHSEDIWLEVRQ